MTNNREAVALAAIGVGKGSLRLARSCDAQLLERHRPAIGERRKRPKGALGLLVGLHFGLGRGDAGPARLTKLAGTGVRTVRLTVFKPTFRLPRRRRQAPPDGQHVGWTKIDYAQMLANDWSIIDNFIMRRTPSYA